MAIADLPQLPAPHKGLARYISEHPEHPMVDIMDPYRKYEAKLRAVYAQDRQNPALDDPHLNVLPLFTDDTKHITTRARNLAAESEEEKSRYIMALPDDKRRPNGSPATVRDIDEFQKNFNVFSESSLAEIDWSNVVAAGSSVVNCLLPVPAMFNTTKRKLRQYYHQKFCPASDVDLFLYGLNHEQAIEKMKQIERAVKDALLHEVTVVRTKYAITIASQYPVRHVQIVLRVYKSVSEILTGFDIDAAGGAYDGSQVYVTPRALGSFITQINNVDLTRRSPSYENRLSKYSHRNFEVYWPDLDRSRVDPTIFERSFQRTLGLARLLVLERLPTSSARETYLDKRRAERGRPFVFRGYRVGGNIKDTHEDEVADWLSEEDISNYHTFSVPYGEKFHAKRIEKLCYTRDLLLNAEWNQPSNREVYLHRHPAFFGRIEDVIEDCCGSCPKPATDKEIEVAEKEAEIYISGKVSFLIDDPGRQQIGSFNPLTEQDWTDMAYVGNTARLCQSIVDGDVDDVLNWLSQDGADPNKRDYTGRSPLHLAVMSSTPEVVRCLVDHGSRLTARLADGMTALHLAAARGNVEMIKILMEKSVENEEAEEERQDRRRKGRKAAGDNERVGVTTQHADESDSSEDESEGELLDDETEADVHSIATGSFIKVKKGENDDNNVDLIPEEAEGDPDYYHIDVLAWDVPCAPLHLAIVGGHEGAVQILCDYGADSILPVKFLSDNDYEPAQAILTLILALSLPEDKAKPMAQLLLRLGATSSQADSAGFTAFHHYVRSGTIPMIDTLLENDLVAVKKAINHLLFTGYSWRPDSIAPLQSAVERGDPILVLKLLSAGAKSHIDFDTWLKASKLSPGRANQLGDLQVNQGNFRRVEQPLITAIRFGNADVVRELLQSGANPNTLTPETEDLLAEKHGGRNSQGRAALDVVRDALNNLRSYSGERSFVKPEYPKGVDEYLQKIKPGTYRHWVVSRDIEHDRDIVKRQIEGAQLDSERAAKTGAVKQEALNEAISELEGMEAVITTKGGKTFDDLYPSMRKQSESHDGKPHSKKEPESKPYEFTPDFSHDSEMTEVRRDGYVKLMEAAWSGNLGGIKALTLQAWGAEKDQPPLKMAIRDSQGNSPFSLAFFGGHHEVARAILEIVKAQWTPEETENVRYKMGNEDDNGSDDDQDSGESSDDEPRIVREKADQTFTIENLGQVSMQVKSHVKPVEVVCEDVMHFTVKNGEVAEVIGPSSIFWHALYRDDAAMLKSILDMAMHCANEKFDEGDEDSNPKFSFPYDDFLWAVSNGKTQLLSIIIKRTGAGIPLDYLVKKSGVAMKRKPRYYQGLTVYGKKRNDWATAGHEMVVKSTGLQTPPLLHAALGGDIDGVEFFLSDTPHKQYSEFAKSKAGREDSRLKHLKESPGGFDRAISKWLGAENDLIINCAVMARPGHKANELLEYLVESYPQFIEKKTSQGDTPLMVACRLGRLQFVRILLAAGADQSTRNLRGENIIHAAIAKNPSPHRLRVLLDLLDPELRSHLFVQRRNLEANGTTPLHSWILGAAPPRIIHHFWMPPPEEENKQDVVGIIELILEYSKGEELQMFNGAGDTCLHTAVMNDMISAVNTLIRFKPHLLYRENAVGRTPAEIALDRVVADKLAKPDRVGKRGGSKWESLRLKNADEYLREAGAKDEVTPEALAALESLGIHTSSDYKEMRALLASMGISGSVEGLSLSAAARRRYIWDLCCHALEQHAGKRRLVSLNEANDVAKRLGESYAGSRYFKIEARGEDDGDDADDEDQQKKSGRATVTQDFPTAMEQDDDREPWEEVNHDSEGEERGLEKCEECGKYHE